MTSLRTALQNEINHSIEYGEAILVALKLKAERQLEVIAPDQHDNLLVFCLPRPDPLSVLSNRCTFHLFHVAVTIRRESEGTTLGTPGGLNAAKKDLWPGPRLSVHLCDGQSVPLCRARRSAPPEEEGTIIRLRPGERTPHARANRRSDRARRLVPQIGRAHV